MKDALRVCYPFVGDSVGGSHISVLALIQGLPREQIRPVVIVHREGPLAEYLRALSVDFQNAPNVRIVSNGRILTQLGEMLGCVIPLARFLRRHRIDIVHTNDRRMHLTWGLAARLAGARFIWHQRTATRSRQLDLFSLPANRVLTISSYCRDTLSPQVRRRARIIKNPFWGTSAAQDRVQQKAQLLEEVGAPRDTTVIGYVGNMMLHKRPNVFVEMAAELCHSGRRQYIFPIFGDPREPVKSEIEELVEKRGLQGRCVVMGARFPIEPWIAGCDVLAVPAVNEGFGRTLVEAMLVRTPVVASADGGHREIVEDGRTGLLVEPDNPAAFAEAVVRLLEDSELASAMTEAAYRVAADTYSVDRHVDAILSVYREVL